jgi:SAM-dependent methyltransferase
MTYKYYSSLYEDSFNSSQRAKFIASQANSSIATIIDGSCGNGKIAFNLARNNYNVIALEEDESLFSIALENFRLSGNPKNKLALLPINISKFTLNSYADCIFFSNSFSHLNDTNLANSIRECSRILRPGGILIFNFPQPNDLRLPQAFAEISRRPLGKSLLVHSGSTNYICENVMSIFFKFDLYYDEKLIHSDENTTIIYLRTLKDITTLLNNYHFTVLSSHEEWSTNQARIDSPNITLVSRKNDNF